MTVRDRVGLLFAAAVAAAVAGCSGNPTATVNGTVTDRAGKTVSGFILFVPQDGAKYREAAEARIVDGRYDLELSVGPKFVSVVVTRDGESIDARPTANSVDLTPGPQSLDVKLK